jgi:hypothetical protein
MRYLPALMALAIGMSVNNSAALVSALIGTPNEFTRTSKYGSATGRDAWIGLRYARPASIQPLTEMAMGVYMTFAVFYALAIGSFGTVPFLMLFQLGFLYTGVLSFAQQRAGNRQRRGASRAIASSSQTTDHAYASSSIVIE